ncbi:hypothetical protein K466DRAFT_592959 [Polyporus arcularius HHB13444]|uniref:Uncharacterized protein n=1 Tax=Polyporus arcularius HHB13444 TaxID=1314778 RepID=A0A5C3NLQ7_9APHY|nr:hypothetical protein K466DRAFT_592959 [Polyporus arcularius HHB13444]
MPAWPSGIEKSSSALLRRSQPPRPVSSARHRAWMPQLRVPDVHAQGSVDATRLPVWTTTSYSCSGEQRWGQRVVRTEAAVRSRSTLSQLIRRRPIAHRPASGGDGYVEYQESPRLQCVPVPRFVLPHPLSAD